MDKLLINLIATAGTRAGYMSAKGIISLPSGADGEDAFAEWAEAICDFYLLIDWLDTPFDEYIETALIDAYRP